MRCLFACSLFPTVAPAASFNYHGNLQDGGRPADGSYDLELTLYSAPQGGRVIGGPLMVYKVPVHNGTFSTSVDFGALAQPVGTSWLGVAVRNSGKGEFAALDARAPVSTALTADTTSSVCPGAWTLDGNAGNPAGSYLGTADNNPLIFEVNGSVVGQILPTSNATYANAPNVVFGSSGNTTGSAVGATIAGGGTSNAHCGSTGDQPCVNSATGIFSTVGGGVFNVASGDLLGFGGETTVSGGDSNTASGLLTTVGGGEFNKASGAASVVSGGSFNTAGYDVTNGSTETYDQYDTVGGGAGNTANGGSSTVSGGNQNIASGLVATVGGGAFNKAAGDYSFAAGSYANVRSSDAGTFVWSDSTGSYSAPFTSTGVNQFLISAKGGVGIGTNNPNGYQLRVVGTNNSIHGDTANGSAWAVSGFNSGTSGNGAGVYGTTTSTQGYGLAGSASANGGVGTLGYATAEGGFGVVASNSANGIALLVQGAGSTSGRVISSDVGGYLSSGGQWVNKSDRASKSGFQVLDVGHVLDKVVAMPVTRWFYKAEGDAIHHIGPVAQDFRAAFGLGSDDKTIGTVDEGGVALAAIQGLNKKVEADNAELQAENVSLKANDALLRTQLNDVLARLMKLEKAGGK
jgi:hypothetical protein